MASQLEWKDRYNLGVEEIDKEHRKLFRIVNRLRAFSGEEEDKASWVYQEALKYFKSYALKHFPEEEAYMAAVSHKELEVHKRLHEDFRNRRLPAIEQELEEEECSNEAITHLRGICTSWLIDHIQAEDQTIVGREISKWSNLLPQGRVENVEQALSEILSEIFGKEPRIISQCYGGEEFGEGIFYRLIYGTLAGEKQEIILIFEKKLLAGILERMEDDPRNRSGISMVEAIQSVEKQLGDMKEFFASQERYELTGENQLTFDQFQRALQRQLPKFSLLFDTGKGYFGYCAMTPHLVRKVETAGKEENEEPEAPKEPEALKEPEAPKKPEAPKEPEKQKPRYREKKKVLVVDDSEMVRQVMKGLLQKDYQVSVAKSGIAAIRSMARERPDLVLLDYNMPVCDGALLLQMMRSEEDFADISVIFLTATIDKASVKRVVPFKPEGYLLKSLKPIEIKNRVDGFFERKGGSR